MNWLDIFLAVLAVIFVVEGIRRGFIRQAIGLAATIIGLLVAAWTYGTAGSFLAPYLSSRSLANIAGFLLVFIGIQILGGLIGWGLSRIFKWSGLGLVDRLLGAGFGVLKALFMGVVFVMILTAFPIRSIPESVAGSRAAPYLIETSHVLVHLAPREIKAGFLDTYDKIKKLWSSQPGSGQMLQRDTA